jgi:glycosyltransferase 2 family protein
MDALESKGKRRGTHRLLVVLGLAVTVVFGYFAVRDAHLEDVWDALLAMQVLWLVPAALLLALCVLLRAMRWRSLFTPSTRPPLRETLNALLVAYFFNSILPLRPGEVARVLWLRRYADASAAEAGVTVIVERAYDILALLILLFLAAPLLPEVSWLDAAAALAAVFAVGLGTAIVVVAVWGERPVLWAARLGARFLPVSRERLEQIGRNAAVGLAGLHRPRLAAVAFGWTMLSWLVLAASCAALLEGFDTGLSTEDVLLAGLLVVIATNFAMILPSSPAALGVFEAATVVALGAFGIDDSEALSYALVLHALNFFPYLVIGGFLVRRAMKRPPATDPGAVRASSQPGAE